MAEEIDDQYHNMTDALEAASMLLKRAGYLLDEIEIQVTKAVERLANLEPTPQQEGKLALSRAELKQVQTWIRNWRMS